ncbi:hypothetical protein TREES_T100003889 [Tupaia chinensis]|uniref:Uncharacterized protein n=1 Tax=Tupaia chinensis TaxID=246437 RepID=L9KYU2_TUPCH|nr:hypothetical protein TREES_T100003889 [Tupaia chinensis]
MDETHARSFPAAVLAFFEWRLLPTVLCEPAGSFRGHEWTFRVRADLLVLVFSARGLGAEWQMSTPLSRQQRQALCVAVTIRVRSADAFWGVVCARKRGPTSSRVHWHLGLLELAPGGTGPTDTPGQRRGQDLRLVVSMLELVGPVMPE